MARINLQNLLCKKFQIVVSGVYSPMWPSGFRRFCYLSYLYCLKDSVKAVFYLLEQVSMYV